MPFASEMQRDIHFQSHGHEFGAADAAQYEQMADAFMTSPRTADMREGVRRHFRHRIRFDDSTFHFGVAVVGPPEVLLSFYIPSAAKVANRGGPPGFFVRELTRTSI